MKTKKIMALIAYLFTLTMLTYTPTTKAAKPKFITDPSPQLHDEADDDAKDDNSDTENEYEKDIEDETPEDNPGLIRRLSQGVISLVSPKNESIWKEEEANKLCLYDPNTFLTYLRKCTNEQDASEALSWIKNMAEQSFNPVCLYKCIRLITNNTNKSTDEINKGLEYTAKLVFSILFDALVCELFNLTEKNDLKIIEGASIITKLVINDWYKSIKFANVKLPFDKTITGISLTFKQDYSNDLNNYLKQQFKDDWILRRYSPHWLAGIGYQTKLKTTMFSNSIYITNVERLKTHQHQQIAECLHYFLNDITQFITNHLISLKSWENFLYPGNTFYQSNVMTIFSKKTIEAFKENIRTKKQEIKKKSPPLKGYKNKIVTFQVKNKDDNENNENDDIYNDFFDEDEVNNISTKINELVLSKDDDVEMEEMDKDKQKSNPQQLEKVQSPKGATSPNNKNNNHQNHNNNKKNKKNKKK